ncbi:hypothetical protein HanHA89_Chr13g0512421 [Helianthus annuus]|nr:hypothetical protein HanHA89_Chr13g0512421 [Helianthus annuus]
MLIIVALIGRFQTRLLGFPYTTTDLHLRRCRSSLLESDDSQVTWVPLHRH